MNTTQTKHTPTPYSISGIAGDNHVMARTSNGKRSIAILVGWSELDQEEFEANKQFIVHACNCHYQLVEACQAAYDDPSTASCVADKLAKALSLAKQTI